MALKIILVGKHCSGKYTTSQILEQQYGHIIGRAFSNFPKYAYNRSVYLDPKYQYYPIQTIHELFETDSIITLDSNVIEGSMVGYDYRTLDESEVLIMSPDQFMALTTSKIMADTIVIWMDTNYEWRYRR